MSEFNLSFAEWKALSNESKVDLMRKAQRRRIERQREQVQRLDDLSQQPKDLRPRLVKTTAPSTTG